MKALISVPLKPPFDTFFTKENIELAESLGEIVWNTTGDHFSTDELKKLIADCDVYVTCWGSPALTKEILDCAPKLRLLTHTAGTVVPFVTDEMWDRGIRVISGNEYFAMSTAEGAITYMLSALRRIPYFVNNLKEKGLWWNAAIDFNDGLLFKTVGIISYGAVAKHLVKYLQPFHVKIKVYDIVDIPEQDKELYGIEQCSIEEIFSSCDIISVHTPLNDHTRHMIDDRLLSLIKKGALFVNTSRGPVIDEEALTRHLENGDFFAALDVYEKEPLDKDCLLLKLGNAHLTPHQAGPTVNLRSVITEHVLLESAAFIDNGEPLKNEITRERAFAMSRS